MKLDCDDAFVGEVMRIGLAEYPLATSRPRRRKVQQTNASLGDARQVRWNCSKQSFPTSRFWRPVMIHVCTGNRTFGNAFARRCKVDRAVADTSPGRILVDP